MQKPTALATTLFSLLLFTSGTAYAKAPHLEMELTAKEYRAIFDRMNTPQFLPRPPRDALQDVLDMGKKNLDWMTFRNTSRAEGEKLFMTSPELQKSYPIDSPKNNSRRLVMEANEALKTELPADMRAILYENAPFTATASVDDDTYHAFARRANFIYESASRWLLQEPHLVEYSAAASQDIRGFYFLNKEENLAEKLANWATLSIEDQSRLGEWLVNECMNSLVAKALCQSNFQSQVAQPGGAQAFHDTYRPAAEKMFSDYFTIPKSRSDVVWTESADNQAVVPFLKPDRADIEDFLRVNIQDEWRWGDWKLILNFVTAGENLTHIVFEEGATAHVNDLAGNIITMDGNASLEDYNERWTIRHEYGHVLGFPDCYVEFYDSDKNVMVNYQIDTTDLMCSRRGHLKENHYNEMKRVYFKTQPPEIIDFHR